MVALTQRMAALTQRKVGHGGADLPEGVPSRVLHKYCVKVLITLTKYCPYVMAGGCDGWNMISRICQLLSHCSMASHQWPVWQCQSRSTTLQCSHVTRWNDMMLTPSVHWEQECNAVLSMH
jgi:hypothetical protein